MRFSQGFDRSVEIDYRESTTDPREVLEDQHGITLCRTSGRTASEQQQLEQTANSPPVQRQGTASQR